MHLQTTREWPTCGNEIHGFNGIVFVCELPLDHGLDGPKWHRDGQVEWRHDYEDDER